MSHKLPKPLILSALLEYSVDLKLPFFSLSFGDVVKDEAGSKREPAQEHEGYRKHCSGEPWNKTGCEEFSNDWKAENQANESEYQCDKAEKLERTIVLK